MSEEHNEEEKREVHILPVEDPAFVEQFAIEYFDTLMRKSERICRQLQIRDYADDALSTTIEKFMTSRIEDRGPRSAISFAMKVLKYTCIDEARRRGRHATPESALMTQDEEDDGSLFDRIGNAAGTPDPESQLMAERELRAVQLGLEKLPDFMGDTHKNVSRDLEMVRLRYMMRLSWQEIAEKMGIVKIHRQGAARGRELLRGWVHALCGSQPEPKTVNKKYWTRGFDAGQSYREQVGDQLWEAPSPQDS